MNDDQCQFCACLGAGSNPALTIFAKMRIAGNLLRVDTISKNPAIADLLERITQVVFLATPHIGSRHANWLDRLRFFAWPTSIARTLVANDPTLRAINVNYRGLAEERRDTLRHRIFYETQGTPIGVIVDEASADPGLPGFG